MLNSDDVKAHALPELEDLFQLSQFRYEILEGIEKIRLELDLLCNQFGSDYMDIHCKFSAYADDFTAFGSNLDDLVDHCSDVFSTLSEQTSSLNKMVEGLHKSCLVCHFFGMVSSDGT